MEGTARCCQNCKSPCSGDFKKAVEFQFSGLVIYVHNKTDEQNQAGTSKYAADTYILHNTGTKQIGRSKYIDELNTFKTKCAQCKKVVQEVRSLLETKTIRKNEVVGVCEHCKRAASPNNTCKRCEFLVSEFIRCKEKQQRFKEWLCKITYVLQAMAHEQKTCNCPPLGNNDADLKRILKVLKEPLRKPEAPIDYFPNLDKEKLMSESKEMLDEIFSKMKFEGGNLISSGESLHPLPSEAKCLCKLLKEKFLGNISGVDLNKSKYSVSSSDPLKEFSGQIQEGYKSLWKRLENLSKALPQASDLLNKDFLQSVIETINSALKQKFIENVVLKLINRLTELHKTLTHDMSKDLNRMVIQSLINDLNGLLGKELSESLNHDFMKLLVDVSDLLTQELSKGLSTEQLKGQSKKEFPQNSTLTLVQKLSNLNKTLAAGVLDKNLVQELSSDIDKILVGVPSDLLIKIVKELTKLCNPAIHGIPPTIDMKLVQGLISDASKTLGQGISKDQNKKTVQGLLKKLNNAIAPGTGEEKKMSLGSSYSKGVISSKSAKHEDTSSKSPQHGETSSQLAKLGDTSSKSAKLGDTSSKSAKHDDTSPKSAKLGDSSSKSAKLGDSSSKSAKLGETTSKSAKLGDTSSKSAKHGDTSSKSAKHDDISTKSAKHGGTSSRSAILGDLTNKSLSETIVKKKTTISKSTLKKTSTKENVLPVDEKNIPAKSGLNEKKNSSESVLRKLLNSPESLKLKRQRQLEMNARKLKDQLSKKKGKKEGKQNRQLEMNKRRRMDQLSMKNKKPNSSSLTSDEMGSESTIVCGLQETFVPKLMIRGDEVIPLNINPKDTEKPRDHEPLLFKAQFEFVDNDPITTPQPDYRPLPKGGKVKYQLSNDEFIHKGWTMLPTQKIMRRMHVYRMKPANPKNCWFNRHKHLGELLYDSGQKMADIDSEGRGCWYYRNGTIALEYYNAEESNVGQRVVVYSCRTEVEYGEITPRTILALFDGLGNGVVYDKKGNARLKYNQTEGIVVDPKIGPPSKWKWHTLNDPPVLEQVISETYLEEWDPRLDRISKPPNSKDAVEVEKVVHPDMLEIELNNFVKEKTCKLKQKFKPFQIRMKSVKLNEQFSLKILDQATIYLLYRDGCATLKLNLGMLLDSDEIIDTFASDIADIAIPYDIQPAKSKSVENIQKILHSVRSGKVLLPSERTINK